MARTQIQIPFQKPLDEARELTEKFLDAQGFHPYPQYGEGVWKKGTGMATAMQYMELAFTPGVLEVSAWVQAGVGSANLGKEMGLDGFVAIVPKRSLKKVIEELKKLL